MSAVEQLADQLLTQRVVIPIDTPAGVLRPGAERSFARHTTRDMLTVERRVLHTALARRGTGVAIADPAALREALAARPSLSAEQLAMVRRLASSGAGVDVVIGKPGTGKSHALAAAAEAWQATGNPVIGAAVAARTAIALSETAGMPAMTVARLLRQVQKSGLPRGVVVVVVDEAGMLPTRQLAQLMDATTAVHGKLVLVGDDKQLPELAAGGAFRRLARHLDASNLTENRRQIEAWERDTLDQLREGHIEPALNSYAAAGRITTAPSTGEQRDALVAAWWIAQQQRQATLTEDIVMLAARRADVMDLNERARTRMVAAGRLTGPTVTGHTGHTEHGERTFAIGDTVIARSNDYQARIFNGQRGTITHIDPQRRTVTLTLKQRQITVGPEYLDAGGLDHGYALTIHQAQGLTTTRALILGNDSLYRESGYVALSRGRIRNDMYTAIQPNNLDPVAEDGHILYGTVVSGSVMAIASQHPESTERIGLEVFGTLVVYWLAHAYCQALWERYAHGTRLRPGEVAGALVHEIGILKGGLAPIAVMLAARLTGVEYGTAVWLGLWTTVLVLFVTGLVAGLRSGARGMELVTDGVIGGLFGLVLVLFKATLH